MATVDEAVLARDRVMAHIICLMRKIPKKSSERCGFSAPKCLFGVTRMVDGVVCVSVVEVGGKEGLKCSVLDSHVWHSLTYVFGLSSDTHVLQRHAGCFCGNHGVVVWVCRRRW